MSFLWSIKSNRIKIVMVLLTVLVAIRFATEEHIIFGLSYPLDVETMTTELDSITDDKKSSTNLDPDIHKKNPRKIKADVILRPPYRIVQFGEVRTGSTFMHQLLYAIVRLKTSPGERINMYHEGSIPRSNFVLKCHSEKSCPRLVSLVKKKKVSVFISTSDRENIHFPSTIKSRALHIQETINIRACSLCEVDAYKGIFNLTDTEIQRVKDYMATYESIRQCCGLQMSRWERMRLHGCNITEEDRARPDYVQCENLNKTEVELKMASNPGGIKYNGMHPKSNWMKVGDCAEFDRKVVMGSGFSPKKKKFVTSVKECNALKGKGKK
mmetsp:Transcript_45937/g.53745  ORF Transcript_45937/g.53745 Transcript_45937/m.53745 type:complete len:326 (-) Transcript_45937:91-1068(-)